MYTFTHIGVNKGLKEYTQYVDSKVVGSFSDLREVTQKPKIVQTTIPSSTDIKATFKNATNKNISIPVLAAEISSKDKKI